MKSIKHRILSFITKYEQRKKKIMLDEVGITYRLNKNNIEYLSYSELESIDYFWRYEIWAERFIVLNFGKENAISFEPGHLIKSDYEILSLNLTGFDKNIDLQLIEGDDCFGDYTLWNKTKA